MVKTHIYFDVPPKQALAAFGSNVIHFPYFITVHSFKEFWDIK